MRIVAANSRVTTPTKLLFLPGASGNTGFWRPVAQRLTHPATRVHVGYPGFGAVPGRPDVNGFDELVGYVASELEERTAVIAQSIGGVIAIMLALRYPEKITHLVLSVTSGGIDTASLGAQDWRPKFKADNPLIPPWLADFKVDLSLDLPNIHTPALLLWGDADPLSPIAVGERLAALLPNASLHVFPGGQHDLAAARAADVARLVDAHVRGTR